MAKIRFGNGGANEIPQGIRTLEVHGTVNETGNDHVVTANKDSIIARGTEDYCHSIVESLLENRDIGYVTPEYWDQFWNYKLGAIWHPDSNLMSSGNTAVLWQKAEEISESSTSAGEFDSWGDIVAGANAPAYVSTSSNNKFPYVDFDGTNDSSFIPQASCPVGLEPGTNNDFCAVFVLDLPDDNSTQTLLQINEMSVTGAFKIQHNSVSTNSRIVLTTRQALGNSVGTLDVSSTFSFTDTNILVCGRINNEHFVRVNGNTAVTATGNGTGPIIGATDCTIGCGYASGINNQFTNMNLYELLYFTADSQNDSAFLTDIIKLEGALARKFDIVSVLPDSHTYKSEPPRVINI